jgi:hypothetical protein
MDTNCNTDHDATYLGITKLTLLVEFVIVLRETFCTVGFQIGF